MKFTIKNCFAFLLALILLSGTALADLSATVNTSALVMREKASKSSKSILAIPEGETLKILSSEGEWSQVIYGDQRGFVMNKYLKFDSSSLNYSQKSINLDKLAKNLQPCKLGDEGENIVLLQSALKSISFFDSNVDGNFGPATEKSVKHFQEKYNLKSDGIVGKGTIEKLASLVSNSSDTKSDSYPRVSKISEIGEAPGPVYPGDNGADVVKLQQALSVLGYYQGSIDGNYGKTTENAVKKFQRKRGLSSDGIAGNGTVSVLFNVPNTKKEKNVSLKNNISKDDEPEITAEPISNLDKIYTIEDIGSVPNTSKPGDKGEDVIKLQQALALSKCYSGNIDGHYGENTEKAVKAFQKKRGMSADGIAGPATIKYLFGSPAANAGSYQSVVAGKNKKSTSDNMNLIETLDDIGSTPSTSRPGQSGTDVTKLQQALTLLGYYNGNIDGNYGKTTEEAVRRFQKKRGMNADGIAGVGTIRVMFGEPASDSQSNSKTNAQDKAMDGIQSIADIGEVPNPCKPGYSGNDVKKLQQALNLLGYYDGNIDGNYGASTENAVKKFQKKRGMNADGLAGSSTIKILFGKAPKQNKSLTSKEEKPSGQDPAMNGINSVKDIGDIPKTSKPGNYSKDVKMLQQALTVLGYYDDVIDSKYGESTKQAVQRFQKKRGMNADGIAGAATIRLIFGSSPKNSTTAKIDKTRYKTEMLDWFTSNAGNLKIPRKAVFEVKDCKTGLVFKAKRWAGVNHIDAEPLTADDAKIMTRIYGGHSWTRRSVLVKYNGHVYAGSMNNMPHGSQTIKGNGYDGHFCIHTLNSKTHGSKKVDHEHQNMVHKAVKYSW